MNKFLVALLVLLFHTSPLACIPCAKNTVAFVNKQGKPVFPDDYKSNKPQGTVTFSIDVTPSGEVKNAKIINMFPEDLPEATIYEMIYNSRFSLIAPSTDGFSMACSVEAQELTFKFLLPQKVEFEIDLNLGR